MTDQAKEWRRVKASLTRAEKSKDPARMIAAARDAETTFEVIGWPDWWTRIERIRSDAWSLGRGW